MDDLDDTRGNEPEHGSHHFLGTGRLSTTLSAAARDPETLLERVAALVEGAGLGVVARQRVDFAGGGHTFVWVLAESHLVLHHWHEEGFATVDLHVCDYTTSNAGKATGLKRALDTFAFAPGTATWRGIALPRPATPEAAGSTGRGGRHRPDPTVP